MLTISIMSVFKGTKSETIKASIFCIILDSIIVIGCL